MTIKYTSPLSLTLAGDRYTDPGNISDPLNEVYGDFTDLGGIAGPIPCTLIDRATFTYTPARHVMQSVTAVYDGSTLLTGGGVDYTLTLSTDYQSQGLITKIVFVSQPTGQVTCRGLGKSITGDDTNAITQLEDLLTTVGGATSADFMTTELETARAAVTLKGYATAWVVNDERAASEWINEFVFNVMGSYYITGTGKLALLVDTGVSPRNDQITANIVASRDCVDGDFGVEMTGDIEHVVNALNIDYLWNWAIGSRSSRITTETDAMSVNAHGEIRKSVTLRGLRSSTHLTTWATVLFARQSMRHRTEGAIVRFVVDGPKLANATVGDYITVSWRFGPTRERDNPYVNQICRIASVRHEFAAGSGRTAIDAIDIGAFRVIDVDFDGAAYYDASETFGGGRELSLLT